MGGPVRTQELRVSSWAQLSGRDRGHPRHLMRENRTAGVGARRGPQCGIRPDRPQPSLRHDRSDTRRTKRGSPSLVRYADDMVALCHTRQEAEQVKARLAAWLAPRGLTFNEDKT